MTLRGVTLWRLGCNKKRKVEAFLLDNLLFMMPTRLPPFVFRSCGLGVKNKTSLHGALSTWPVWMNDYHPPSDEVGG